MYLSSIVTGRGGKRNSLEKKTFSYIQKGMAQVMGNSIFLLEFLYMFFQFFLTVETRSEMSEFSIG